MDKESGKDNLTTMQGTILKLEEKNKEFDGLLFATFGKGEAKALIFPTPLKTPEITPGTGMKKKFLLVENRGFHAISVVSEDGGKIAEFIKDKLEKKPSIFDRSGYKNLKFSMDGSTFITREGLKIAKLGLPLYRENFHGINCKLAEIDEGTVQEILNINIERVEKIRSSAQSVSKALQASAKIQV
jgi:hypothetical protein